MGSQWENGTLIFCYAFLQLNESCNMFPELFWSTDVHNLLDFRIKQNICHERPPVHFSTGGALLGSVADPKVDIQSGIRFG